MGDRQARACRKAYIRQRGRSVAAAPEDRLHRPLPVARRRHRRRRSRRRSATFAELIHEGKVRAIGASNYSAARLERSARAPANVSACRATRSLQPLYNLMERAALRGRARAGVRASNGLGVINFYALAAGFLTGKYRSERRPRQERARRRRRRSTSTNAACAVLAALDAVAGRRRRHARRRWRWRGRSPGPSITAPIASATIAGAARRAGRRRQPALSAADQRTARSGERIESRQPWPHDPLRGRGESIR